MPFKFGPGQEGEFADCVKFFMGKKNPRTGKKFKKDAASAVCATIERRQVKESLQQGKHFVLATYQLGPKKWLELRFELDNEVDIWLINTPGKTGAKINLGGKVPTKRRGKQPMSALNREGIIPRNQEGGGRDFSAIYKILDKGTYNLLQKEPTFTKIRLNGQKLSGVFQIERITDQEVINKTKYQYLFSKAKTSMQSLKMQGLKIAQELKKVDGKEVLQIKGVALREGTWNGLFYPRSELRRYSTLLKGVPLLTDHSKSVKDIVGRVVNSFYNEALNQIEFEADVWDEQMIDLLNKKMIDSVSVGVVVDRVREDGQLTARNYEFKELSLVMVPACDDCKITEVNPKAGG